MGAAYDRVIEALETHGSRRTGPNYNCPGPLHSSGDRKPSLQVSDHGDKVGLHCYTGCATGDILSELGLAWSDLFEDDYEIKRYPYTDAARALLHVKTRYPKKGFDWVHPELDDWKGGQGNERVLYRLPEVLEGIKQGRTIYLVEGEKDADRLAVNGEVATTNPNGASERWKASYTESLSGAKVVIIADRDEPGVEHARKVAEALKGHTVSCRIVQSATEGKGHDVSDHLDAEYTLDALVPLSGTHYKIVSLVDLLKKGVPAPNLLCGGFLYEGGLHSIAGAPDSGKTTIGLQWAISLLRAQRQIFFMDEEGGPEIVTEKLAALGAVPDDLDYLTYIPFPGRTWTAVDIEDLTFLVEDQRPAMMLWDSSAGFLARAGLDENAASDVTRWWGQVLTPMAREYKVAMLVIDHDTKSSEQSRYARGSGAKLAAIDCQFKVELVKPFSRDQDGILKLTVTKDRRGYLHRTWRVRMETGSGLISADFYHEAEDSYMDSWPPARRKLYGVLSDTEQTIREILDVIKENFSDEKPVTHDTASRELNELLRDGYVSRTRAGVAATWRVARKV
jgi:hypothetical protein